MDGFKKLRRAKGFRVCSISPVCDRSQPIFMTRSFSLSYIPLTSFANEFHLTSIPSIRIAKRHLRIAI